MRARVKSAFEDNAANSHPFVKELYKKARNNAKKFEQAVALEQMNKGKSMSDSQAEKVKKQQAYQMAVDEAIDSLNLFLKHFKPEPQDEAVFS